MTDEGEQCSPVITVSAPTSSHSTSCRSMNYKPLLVDRTEEQLEMGSGAKRGWLNPRRRLMRRSRAVTADYSNYLVQYRRCRANGYRYLVAVPNGRVRRQNRVPTGCTFPATHHPYDSTRADSTLSSIRRAGGRMLV